MSAVAENIESVMPEPIVFTDSAAAKVADLIAEEGNPELKLRVFVQGGGCSGFQYGFTFDEITNEEDTPMSKNGVCRPKSPVIFLPLIVILPEPFFMKTMATLDLLRPVPLFHSPIICGSLNR